MCGKKNCTFRNPKGTLVVLNCVLRLIQFVNWKAPLAMLCVSNCRLVQLKKKRKKKHVKIKQNLSKKKEEAHNRTANVFPNKLQFIKQCY